MFRLAKYFFALVFTFTFFLPKAQNADIGLLRNFHTSDRLKADGFFRSMSQGVNVVSVGVPVFYFCGSLFHRKRDLKENPWFQQCIRTGVGIGSAGLISYGLKISLKRERPYVKYGDIVPKDEVSTHSFPSGHTTFAFATATLVSLQHKKWYITVPAFAWAGLAAYSRLHLGVHYPTDVLAGMVIGSGTAYVVYRISQKWFAPSTQAVPRTFN